MTMFYLAVRGPSWIVLNSIVLIHCVQLEEYIKYPKTIWKKRKANTVNSNENKSYILIPSRNLKVVDKMGIDNCYDKQSTYFSSL